MNLRNVDLNLLTILDALLEEAHVSRAAKRLNLSQPATSNALARARALFKDELLVRGTGGLKLTAKAKQLRGPLRQSLGSMEALIAADPPALENIRQTVRLVLSDFPAAFVAGNLLCALKDKAPGIDLVFHPWHAGDEIVRLRRAEIDMAITVQSPPGDDLRIHEFGMIDYQVIMRQGHPAAADFSLAQWLQFPHLLVSGQGEPRGPIDAALARQGLSRRVGAVVPTFLLALRFLEESDLIAALPTQMLPQKIAGRFAIFDPPIPLDPFPLYLIRHRRSDDDLAVRFVADAIAAQIKPASGLEGSAYMRLPIRPAV